MTLRAKTIQIFLPCGDPRGVRVAEMTTRIVQVIEVPRSLLADFLAMPESGQVALYFLFGESEDGTNPRVYIGQTGDLRARLTSHNKEKDFWERAVVLISRTNNLTQTHALYLEWHCLQAATEAERYQTDNGTRGTRPHTPAPLEADCLEMFETGHALLATLGYPLFDPVRKPVTQAAPVEEFILTSSGANGRGLYTTDGFVVLQGSSGRAALVPSVIGTSTGAMRQSLIDAGVIAITGDTATFAKDHLFRTPSGAACAVLGRTANGWIEWTTKDGRTLDAVKRQIL